MTRHACRHQDGMVERAISERIVDYVSGLSSCKTYAKKQYHSPPGKTFRARHLQSKQRGKPKKAVRMISSRAFRSVSFRVQAHLVAVESRIYAGSWRGVMNYSSYGGNWMLEGLPPLAHMERIFNQNSAIGLGRTGRVNLALHSAYKTA